MPAKPLDDEQRREAARLKSAFKLWQSARRDAGQPWTQDEVAELFGFGQSALSQYLNGIIPLNATALATFAHVIGLRPALISPRIVRAAAASAAALLNEPAAPSADAQDDAALERIWEAAAKQGQALASRKSRDADPSGASPRRAKKRSA